VLIAAKKVATFPSYQWKVYAQWFGFWRLWDGTNKPCGDTMNVESFHGSGRLDDPIDVHWKADASNDGKKPAGG
jgi:hypothetical protein